MNARMVNPLTMFPDALKSLIAFGHAADNGSVPSTTLTMVHLRASQINGCGVCVDMHARELRKAGESDERVLSVAAWRDTPYYDDAERAALALTEYVTRLSDQADPVPDAIWAEAAEHYDEKGLASLVVAIATINAFNRVNAATKQVAGAW